MSAERRLTENGMERAETGYVSLRAMMSAIRIQERHAHQRGSGVSIAGIDRRALSRRLYERFRNEISDEAVNGLCRRRPQESAKRLMTRRQALIAAALLAGSCIAFAAAPAQTFVALNVLAALYFIAAVFFRMALMILSRRDAVGATRPHAPSDDVLPVVTILLPLYRDGASLPSLAQAIGALDYPAHKKDVKLLLEEDDAETLAAAIALGLDARYDIIIAPPEGPRTKPKACNVGLQLARGDLIVIYDAEDVPEPDQLKKAAAAFAAGDKHLACVQARLNFYNHDDNWLTQLFTLEYSLWFDWLLPGLQRLGAPIPLGGTSNIFRTETLIAAGGWDPYNVTEDADLGLRLARLGYRVEVLDSTTFEEANCRAGNWLRQRSRWLKGYLQTWLVHMRDPARIIRATGWTGFLSVQMFVAGALFSAVVNPLMIALSLVWFAAGAGAPSLPAALLALNLAALVAGNLFFALTLVFAPVKRNAGRPSAYGLTAPAYWLLTSLAAYKALAQAATRPHYWEKTDHVISPAARQRNEAARAALDVSGETTPAPCHRLQDAPI
ncbi:MAG: glycosyltransferase [Parvularculaceae bacterium]